ncbi:hypothetical protein ACOMHN_060801 [Nucella lapillus]
MEGGPTADRAEEDEEDGMCGYIFLTVPRGVDDDVGDDTAGTVDKVTQRYRLPNLSIPLPSKPARRSSLLLLIWLGVLWSDNPKHRNATG